MSVAPRYQRILLKLSGEALMGPDAHGLHMPTLEQICADVADAVRLGVQIAIVVGGGNIFRGMQGVAKGMSRADADQMGMLATVMNALALRDALDSKGLPSRALSAIPMPTVCEPFTRARAVRHLDKGHVVVCGGGTGNPYFTTDTTAVLRAAELNCAAVFKGTQVDGIYSADPRKTPDATRYDTLSYDEALARKLQVMDAAAIALARDNAIPIVVFCIQAPGGLASVLQGEGRYTTVTP